MTELVIIQSAKNGKLPGSPRLPQTTSETMIEDSQSSVSTSSDDLLVVELQQVSSSVGTPAASSTVTASNTMMASITHSKNSNRTISEKHGQSSISSAIAALFEPLTKFTLFPNLPIELRYKVFNLSLKPQDVYIESGGKYVKRHVMSMVCKEFKAEYERQYTTLGKAGSRVRHHINIIFVNYKDDYVHFPAIKFTDKPLQRWAWLEQRTRMPFITTWMKPVQRLAIRLDGSSTNKGLCAPECPHGWIWRLFNSMCPKMKELILIMAEANVPMEDLVELKNLAGPLGVGEAAIRLSFKKWQRRGVNVSAKLVIMGQQQSFWDLGFVQEQTRGDH